MLNKSSHIHSYILKFIDIKRKYRKRKNGNKSLNTWWGVCDYISKYSRIPLTNWCEYVWKKMWLATIPSVSPWELQEPVFGIFVWCTLIFNCGLRILIIGLGFYHMHCYVSKYDAAYYYLDICREYLLKVYNGLIKLLLF